MLLISRSSAEVDLYLLVTCLSILVLDEIAMLRYLARDANGMSELPTPTEVGAKSGSLILSDFIYRLSSMTLCTPDFSHLLSNQLS